MKEIGNHNLNNSRFREQNKSGKQNWLNPEITKIKLNPEQAVLSCCDAVYRDAVSVSFGPSGTQCNGVPNACLVISGSSISS
jgi:hypothetical protein